MNAQTSYDKGRWAEWLAIFYLWGKGYRILQHRYKTKVGEIDIIAKQGNTIRFIEVKARPTESEALEAVTQHARHRIIRTAQDFLQKNSEYQGCEIGFDVMAILSYTHIKHLRFAFSYEDFI